MKKSLFVLLAVSLLSTGVNAQESENQTKFQKNSYETRDFWSNWSLTLAGGAQFYMGENDKYMDFGDRITPAVDLFLHKWVSPVYGFGIGATGLQVKGLYLYHIPNNEGVIENGNIYASWPKDKQYLTRDGGKEYNEQNGFFVNPFLYFALDLDNLFAGYKYDRFYNVAIYAGGGLGVGFDQKERGYNHVVPTFNAGIINKFRLCEKWSLLLNLRGALVGDDFDGESRESEPTESAIIKNIPMDGIFGATVGISYNFGKRPEQGFRNAANTVYYDQMIAAKDQSIERLGQNLQNADAREKELLATLQQMKENSSKENHKLDLRFHINFDIDKSILTNRELLDLQIISEIMKQDESIKYNINGYADVQTGSENRNDTLSQDRVNAVVNVLTEKYGVNPDQLVTNYNGGVDTMFLEDNTLSRCVMITTVK